MIEFEALVMKAETNNIYTIFLLKKNIKTDIIKTILGYLPMTVLKTLREWEVAIILVEQKYKSIENWQNYRIRTEIIYRGRSIFMNIRKTKENFDKDRKPRYFNYNMYRYIAKECQKLKKKWDTRKYYKCNKVEYITKDYKAE